MLNQRPLLHDLQLIDKDLFSSLTWLLDNDVDSLEMTFDTEVTDACGHVTVSELKPGGSELLLTNQNKRDFVALKTNHLIMEQRRAQLDAIRQVTYGIWHMAYGLWHMYR